MFSLEIPVLIARNMARDDHVKNIMFVLRQIQLEISPKVQSSGSPLKKLKHSHCRSSSLLLSKIFSWRLGWI